jgi:hypothetical protein
LRRNPELRCDTESPSEENAMANREQRKNKEKKKPKADKNQANKPASAPSYVQPELVRKPHKGKQDY